MRVWAAEWENDLGERQYQPRLPSGEAQWAHHYGTLLGFWSKDQPEGYGPSLYKHRETAEKIARERYLEVSRTTWRRIS